jgi:hypothetical protein
MYTHRVYVKHPVHTKNQFRPINGEGGYAINLIHAMMFTKENAVKAQKQLAEQNPEFEFVVRKI